MVILPPCISICYEYSIFIRFGAEGQFMPTWHDFKSGVKLRQSKNWVMKMLTNKEKRKNVMGNGQPRNEEQNMKR